MVVNVHKFEAYNKEEFACTIESEFNIFINKIFYDLDGLIQGKMSASTYYSNKENHGWAME